MLVRPTVADIGKYSLSINACFNTGNGEGKVGRGAVVHVEEGSEDFVAE